MYRINEHTDKDRNCSMRFIKYEYILGVTSRDRLENE
jgi:hypothetical protein